MFSFQNTSITAQKFKLIVLGSDSRKNFDSFLNMHEGKKKVYEISLVEEQDSVIQDEEALHCSQSGRITFASTYSQCRALHRLAA